MRIPDKLKVPPTSTLILQYARELYTTPVELKYLSAIDFSEVSDLSRDIYKAYPVFKYMVCFRKQCIRGLVKEYAARHPVMQVVILGAGLDPLTLHLTENYGDMISHIFEVDNGHILEKREIYNALLNNPGNLHLIKCDLKDTQQLMEKLHAASYNPKAPTLIIFEGVIHYMTNVEFMLIMQQFKTDNKGNMVVMEYSLEDEDVPASHLPGHKAVMNLMEAYIHGRFNVNTRKNMLGLIAALGGRLERLEAFCETEKKLTGDNRIFKQPGEGLAEMAAFHI